MRPSNAMNDTQISSALQLIDMGQALARETEDLLEARGLIVTSDAPYAALTETGRAFVAANPVIPETHLNPENTDMTIETTETKIGAMARLADKIDPAAAQAALDDAGVKPAKKAAKKPAAKKPAAKKQPAAAKKVTPGRKAAKRSTYAEEITDAVRRAKKARGTTHGAPGAKQHVALRDALAAEIGGDVTKDALLKWLGLSETKLRDAASGAMSTEDLRKAEAFKKVQRLDALQDPKIRPWVGGRNGASILVAWVDQIKAAK